MDYYDKKNIRTMETFKLALMWLAYIIIFWTLYNINVILFTMCIAAFVVIKVFKVNIMCRLFGHIESDKPIHGVVRCNRCGYPMYRINKN